MSETKKEYSPQISEAMKKKYSPAITKAMKEAEMFWEDLVGEEIIQIRRLTDEEMERSFPHWFGNPIIIRLGNGTALIPMSDDEGNDGGAMQLIDWKGNQKTLYTK